MENGSRWTARTASEARELFSGARCEALRRFVTGNSALNPNDEAHIPGIPGRPRRKFSRVSPPLDSGVSIYIRLKRPVIS